VHLATSGKPTRASTLTILCPGIFWASTMPDQWLLSIVMDLRARAEEILARADSFHDAEAKQKMRRIAETYEKLAERLERHARDGDEG
jgi:hypothetical protein